MRGRVMMAAAAVVVLAAVAPRHIELVSSNPAADTVLTAPPSALLLTFSAELDFERSAATMRSASGTAVKLGKPGTTDDPRQMTLPIEDELGAGRYLVSWVAAPRDDHGGRGRFSFEISGDR